MDVELMALGFLMSGPKTGYQMQKIAGKLLLNYNLSLNQIYPTLRKFEASGLVRKETVLQSDRPNKNVYSLTDRGRQFFLERVSGPPAPLDYRLDFLARVFFFRFLEPEQRLRELEKEINSLDEQLDDLRSMDEATRQNADQFGRFAYLTAIHMLQCLRDWYQAELDGKKAEQ